MNDPITSDDLTRGYWQIKAVADLLDVDPDDVIAEVRNLKAKLAEAERRGAVKALQAEAQRGHRAAEEFRDDDPYQQRLGRKLLRRTADAIDSRADQIESGEVTL